jgi:2-polyprenyl-3-methyl-5-hydroxy-6-metoxy-1,4-benzoquinol methylase
MTEDPPRTRERQYQPFIDLARDQGFERLGVHANLTWRDDPRQLVFRLARYKFVSKMFSGLGDVLEIGCGDAFGSRIVQQEVRRLSVTDFDPVLLADAQERQIDQWPLTIFEHDFVHSGPAPNRYDGIYAIDVLEHISHEDEAAFLANLVASLRPQGVTILGMPSLESQPYASPTSKMGHVNCKTMPDFKAVMQRQFANVFMFSMNDEVVHTGFHKMAHYLFALCCGPRENR